MGDGDHLGVSSLFVLRRVLIDYQVDVSPTPGPLKLDAFEYGMATKLASLLARAAWALRSLRLAQLCRSMILGWCICHGYANTRDPTTEILN